jgi:ribosomal protein S18 acetylase RimI-like enzyme
MNIAIRLATAADIPSLSELFLQSAAYHTQQAPYFFRLPSKEWICEFFEGHLKNPVVTLLVAELDSKIVGAARAEVRNSPEVPLLRPLTFLHIEEIVVAQNYRRKGVAKALMTKIEEIAQTLNLKQVTLNVWNFNDSTKFLYENLGYGVQRSIMKKDL